MTAPELINGCNRMLARERMSADSFAAISGITMTLRRPRYIDAGNQGPLSPSSSLAVARHYALMRRADVQAAYPAIDRLRIDVGQKINNDRDGQT
jgi:hypothetical protein